MIADEQKCTVDVSLSWKKETVKSVWKKLIFKFHIR